MRAICKALIVAATLALALSGSAQEQQQPKRVLSIAEMIGAAQSTAEKGQELAKTVDGLLRSAKEDGDMMKVTCLTDKQAHIVASLKTMQGHIKTLRAAKDRAAAEHEHTMIGVLAQKLDVLGQEAGQCVGADAFETGATTVESTISKDLIDFEENAGEAPTLAPPSLPTLPPAVSGLR